MVLVLAGVLTHLPARQTVLPKMKASARFIDIRVTAAIPKARPNSQGTGIISLIKKVWVTPI